MSRMQWSIFLVLSGVTVAFLCSLHSLPFLDLPNHTVRAYVIGHLQSDIFFAENFRYRFHFLPYILGDLFYSIILKIFDLSYGPQIWMSLIYISLPLSVIRLCRTARLSQQETFLAALTALYFSSGWHFLSGYTNFCLSVSLAFVTLSIVLFPPSRRPLHALDWLLFAFLQLITYLTHLGGFFFCGVLTGTIIAYRFFRREYSFLQSLVWSLPVAVLVLTHVALGNLGASSEDTFLFRPFAEKFELLGGMFYRFHLGWDAGIFSLFALSILALIFGSPQKEFSARSREFALLAAISFLFYFLLPEELGPTSDVDNRALPFAAIFSLLTLLTRTSLSAQQIQRATILSLILCITNAAYLSSFLRANDLRLTEYRELFRALPEHAKLFPVATQEDIGRLSPNLHVGELACIERHAAVPFVFSERTSGNQIAYFTYLYSLYTPDILWYIRGETIDWNAVRRDYTHLLVTKPYDQSRFPMDSLSLLAENPAGALFEVAALQ